jgi:pyrroloquinoline quinone (PQQ) biosynthesis protein C
MAIAHIGARCVSGEELVDELERKRTELSKERPIRGTRELPQTLDALAARRRRQHRGGANTVNRNGERYINCPVKSIRRIQLRKIVDEAGQDIFGGPMPSHEILDRWESTALGLTNEEIDRLEKEDNTPDGLIFVGWWIDVHRNSHWSVGIGTAFAGEGEKLNVEARKRLLDDLEAKRELYTRLGVKDLEKAMTRDIEHSGVDIDHAEFDREVILQYCDTIEAQDQMRRAFVLRMQRSWM